MEVMRQKPRKKTRSCPDNCNTKAIEMFWFSRDDMSSPEIELLSFPDSKKKPIKTQLDTRVALDRPSFASLQSCITRGFFRVVPCAHFLRKDLKTTRCRTPFFVRITIGLFRAMIIRRQSLRKFDSFLPLLSS